MNQMKYPDWQGPFEDAFQEGDGSNALVNLMRGILNSPGLGLATSKESTANSGHGADTGSLVQNRIGPSRDHS
jgi:hypothetical protein